MEEINGKMIYYHGQILDLRFCNYWTTDKNPTEAFRTLLETNQEGKEYFIDYDTPIDISLLKNTLDEYESAHLTFKKFKPQTTKYLKRLLEQKEEFPIEPEKTSEIFWTSKDYGSLSEAQETMILATDYSSLTDQWVYVSKNGLLRKGKCLTANGEIEAILSAVSEVEADIILILTDSISSIDAFADGQYNESFEGKSVCVRYVPAHIYASALHVVADWASRVE